LRATEAAAAVRRFEPYIRETLVDQEVDRRLRILEIVPGARQIVAFTKRFRDGGLNVGERSDACGLFGRLGSYLPERGVVRVDNQPPQGVLRVAVDRVGADQVLAPLRYFSIGLHEIERRYQTGGHPRLRLSRELLREIERPLLHDDVR